MNRDQILKELREERDRLSQAISALEGAAANSTKPAGRPGRKKGSGGGITAAGRKRLSEMMRKRWAERRKAAGKSK